MNESTEDANAQLYEALLKRKQMEQQHIRKVLSETQSMTEAMLQKQRASQQSKLVVSAIGEQYVNNARYIQINSGLESRIQVFPSMHPLSPDECDVYSSLVEKCQSGKNVKLIGVKEQVVVMHNHCMSEQGMIEGFRFTVDPRESSSCLPVCRKMFFRHSMVECQVEAGQERIILDLLIRQNEAKAKLITLMQRIHAESQGKEADFDCMPENVDRLDTASSSAEIMGGTHSTPLLSCYSSRRAADCRDWKPEMPELIGLYHAYVKGFNKDVRHHKLFLIVSGGCHNMSDKFYNLSVDVRGSMQVDEILESEEAYYLRRINGRSNAKLLLRVAQEFNLKIPTMSDPCGYDTCRMAACTTETYINDMIRQRDRRISVLSKCADTTRVENGVLCSMHPGEGFWLFKGATRTHSSMNCYGGPFGSEEASTCIPVCMHRMHANYSWNSKVVSTSPVCNRQFACSVESRSRSTSAIAKVSSTGDVIVEPQQTVEKYTYMDEDFIRALQEHMKWNRDNGIIELMPIAVVYQGESDIF